MATKEKILDTAERLIADQGYAATSLRQVIAEARVNLAAVHYHFGSKEDLLNAVVVRKAAPVNEARIARLKQVESEAGTGCLNIEKVLEALLLPTAEAAQRNPEFVRLMGRMLSEGMMPRIVERHFLPVVMHFITALGRATPELPEDELMWRVHFMLGAMAHTMCSPPLIPLMAGETADMERRMKQLVTFLSAGFRAATTASKEK